MTQRHLRILLILLIPITLLAGELLGSDETESPRAKVFLPRTQQVETDEITVGQVAIVSAKDLKLEGDIQSVTLGRAPFPGETITLTRKTIASRLARNGYFAPNIELMGATRIQIQRNCDHYTSTDLVDLADQFLIRRRREEGISWKCVQTPKELAAVKEVELQFELDRHSPAGHARVLIRAVRNGKPVDTRKVLFRKMYHTQTVVAKTMIPIGSEITPDNATIESLVTDEEPVRWESPFGLKAKISIDPGQTITSSMTIKPEPIKVHVDRNRMVRIKLTGPGWKITAIGKAMQSGDTGDLIKVRNIDSNKIIVARIDEIGDVIPLMNRAGKRSVK